MTTVERFVDARSQAGGVNESDESGDPDPEVPERARGPRRYSAKYKARILEEYEALNKAGKGALLRREGLYSSLISEWRKQRDRGALEALARPSGRPQVDPRDREVARLRRQNERLEAELVGRDQEHVHVTTISSCPAPARRAASTASGVSARAKRKPR